MPTQRVLFLVAFALLVVGRSCHAQGHSMRLWPRPQRETTSAAQVVLDAASFNFSIAGHESDILTQAIVRYQALTFINPTSFPAIVPNGAPAISSISVDVLSSDETLSLQTNESYTLSISSSGASLVAETVYGALRGLETFSQLSTLQVDQLHGAVVFVTNETEIQDYPRFHHRGYMIDTSRHWLPLTTIKQQLDAMAYSKFSVLHWHIVDGQSFPYQSEKFPQLWQFGAYTPTHVYSFAEVKEVLMYAKYRGIRVVVEFDTPGHTFPSWNASGVLTKCYSGGTPSSLGPINPTLNATFPFLTAFWTEVATLFPDDYVHLGGDEVSFDCWQSNPGIQAWMKAKGWTDYALLEQFYETSLLDIVGKIGKDYVVWQEIFDNGLKVKPNTVINVWKGGWQKEMDAVTKKGLRALLSSPWYLNYISYGEDWPKYYAAEPLDFNGTQAQQTLVAGGEVCMWAEYVDATNSLSRTWPRACAVGERLWSARNVTDQGDAAVRLHTHRCRLLLRNIPAEPCCGPSYCDFEWVPSYSPPWGQ